MNQSATVQHESNRRFYDRISEGYDFLADANEKEARKRGVDALNVKPGESVLELGFGTGNEVIELAETVGANGRVSGIDISSGMLAVTQRKLSHHRVAAQIDLRVADARQLPFADAAFDAIYTSFTLELFPDADIPTVLHEARRVLKPDGRIGVVAMYKPQPGDHISFLEKTYTWMHRHFPHIVDCHPIDVRRLLEGNGFRIESELHLEIWTLPVAVVAGRPA